MRTKQKPKPRVTSASPLESLPRAIPTSDRPIECPGTPIGLQGIRCERIGALGKTQNDIDETSCSVPSIGEKVCNCQTETNRKQKQKLQDVLLQRRGSHTHT